MDAMTLRNGIYAMHTRRLGSVAEMLVQRLVKLGKGRHILHDLFDDMQKHRVEVKFSAVRKKSEIAITEQTVLQAIAAAAAGEERMVDYGNWKNATFDSNIQQIKRKQFEVLYYGLFFSDVVLIFRITNAKIGHEIKYSDRQHFGNVGEGQFHINDRTLQYHLDNFLYKKLTYDQLLKLLK